MMSGDQDFVAQRPFYRRSLSKTDYVSKTSITGSYFDVPYISGRHILMILIIVITENIHRFQFEWLGVD